MTRELPPCSACGRFVPAQTGTGHCTGFNRAAGAEDRPCVLYLEHGSRQAREEARSSQERLAEMQRRHSSRETISRASATTAAPQPERAT